MERRNLTTYSACFAYPKSLSKTSEEVRRLSAAGVKHLMFEFHIINVSIMHSEPEETVTELMSAQEAYNWIAGQSKAIRIMGYAIRVQLYRSQCADRKPQGLGL